MFTKVILYISSQSVQAISKGTDEIQENDYSMLSTFLTVVHDSKLEVVVEQS